MWDSLTLPPTPTLRQHCRAQAASRGVAWDILRRTCDQQKAPPGHLHKIDCTRAGRECCPTWEQSHKIDCSEPVPEAGVVPPVPMWDNILDLPEYSQFYADVREGLFAGRKCAEGYPTPLPVTVDGHPGQFAHTILRDGDLCAIVCTVEARVWRDRSSGKWHGQLNFVLRIRVHGQNDMIRQTTPPPTARLTPRRVIASPVKRSAMDAELDIDLSGTDGHSVTDNNKKSDSRVRDAVDDFGEEAADKDREVSSGRVAGSSRRIGKARA